MTLHLGSHFVAFIDILGFSEMVRADCESSDPPRYLQLLHDSHLRAIGLFGRDLEGGLMQFSDSIIFSKPFDFGQLAIFIDAVSSWQKSLLLDGLLCRGGVTFGKHFVKDKFLFSKAMIDAYVLETSQARFPRIVVSNDLIELASAEIPISSLNLCKGDDGAIFVDYLRYTTDAEKETLAKAVIGVTSGAEKLSSSVQEKLRWLTRYADHTLGTTLSPPHFIPV
jgi:hypothetical protein